MTRPLTLLLALSTFASAQTRNHAVSPTSATTNPQTQQYVLAAMKVTGSKRFSDVDVIAASGLKLHQRLTLDDLKTASDLIGQGGAFSSVQYTYSSLGMRNIQATYQVVDNPEFLPAVLENLVWMPSSDLVAAVHQRLPLFDGTLPIIGNMQEQVRTAIVAILKEKGIEADIAAQPLTEIGKPPTGIAFSANDVNVHISSVELPGSTQLSDPEMKMIVKAMTQEQFTQSVIRRSAELDLLPFYESRGYLAAKLGAASFALTKSDPKEPEVALTIPVTEGTVYKFAGATITGNNAVPASEIGKLVPLQLGEVANLVKFRAALSKMRQVYGPLGMMEASSKIVPTLNPDGTAVFAVTVHEGVPYHMGKMEIVGLDPSSLARLKQMWRLAPGDVYNDNYPKRFMGEIHNFAPPGAMIQYKYKEVFHDDVKSVDVAIEVHPRP